MTNKQGLLITLLLCLPFAALFLYGFMEATGDITVMIFSGFGLAVFGLGSMFVLYKLLMPTRPHIVLTDSELIFKHQFRDVRLNRQDIVDRRAHEHSSLGSRNRMAILELTEDGFEKYISNASPLAKYFLMATNFISPSELKNSITLPTTLVDGGSLLHDIDQWLTSGQEPNTYS